MPQQIRGQCDHLCWRNNNLVNDVESLPSITFRQNPFIGCRARKVENASANQRSGWPFFVDGSSQKNKRRWSWAPASYQVSFGKIPSADVEEKSKICQQVIGQCGYLCANLLTDRSKKQTNKQTNKHKIGEGRWVLAPSVKFRQNPFSGCKGEVETIRANHRPWWPSLSTDMPEQKLWEDVGYFLPVKFHHLESVQLLRKRSPKCLDQSEIRATIFVDGQVEKHKLSRGHCVFAVLSGEIR